MFHTTFAELRYIQMDNAFILMQFIYSVIGLLGGQERLALLAMNGDA